MKVLYICGKDVYNIPAVNIIKKFQQRGHLVEVYSMYHEYIHIRMISEICNDIRDYQSLNEEKINEFDIIFSGQPITEINLFTNIRKYIFVFSTCYMDEPYSYGDFTFTQRDISNDIFNGKYKMEVINNNKNNPSMAVGNPKFDDIEINNIESNVILIVDSGHYPYGNAAKLELAKLIVNISKSFKEYEILVKPRFLPDDKNVTHRNDDYLYPYIYKECNNIIPSNLNLLMEHTSLEELVNKSKVVITVYSTSYLDVAVAHKGGIIVDGLPSEESVAHSNKHIKRLKVIMEKSGCMRNYKEIISCLPEGLTCNEKHLNEMVYSTINVSDSIVKVVEYIFYNILNRNEFPCDGHFLYNDDLSNIIDSEMVTWEKVIHQRYKKRLFEFSNLIYRASDKLDFQEIIYYILDIEKKGVLLNKDNFESYQIEVKKKVSDYVIKNSNILMHNKIEQCYLLKIYYENGMLNQIEEKDILCQEFFNYLMGKSQVSENPQLAIHYLLKYLSQVNNNLFERTLADDIGRVISANFYLGVSLYKLGNGSEALSYFMKCQELTDGVHKKAGEYIAQINTDIIGGC